MIISAFFFNPQGDHRVSWRHPRAPLQEVYGLAYFQNLAAAAEAAKLDTLFNADHVGIWDTHESNLVYYANPRLEPITLLSSLAAVTSKLGLLATISASYTEPYNLARLHFAILRTIKEAQRYRADFQGRLVAAGREPQDIKISTGHPPDRRCVSRRGKRERGSLKRTCP